MTNLVEIESVRIDADVVRVLELALNMAKRGDLFCVAICADCTDGASWNVLGGPVNTHLLGALSYAQARINHYLIHKPA